MWIIPDIKASSYGPQAITSVIENAEKNVKEYEFYYAISGNDSPVDWVKPDTVNWQKFSVSESPQAVLNIGSWEKYSGKYLLVKGILKTEKGETVSSTYFTQNATEYINDLYEIPMKGYRFVHKPGIDENIDIAKLPEKAHLLLQLYSIPNLEERKIIENLGINLLDYIHEKSYFVSFPANKLNEIVKNLLVRYIGPILPNEKISPYLKTDNFMPWNLKKDGTLVLVVKFFKDVFLEEAKRLITAKQLGSVVDKVSQINALVVEDVPKEKILELANEDIVQWVEEAWPVPMPELDESRPAINVDDIQSSPYNLSGTGVDVMIYDSGKISHPDFDNRAINADNEISSVYDHPTHVAGIVGGASTTQSYYGIATSTELIVYDYYYSATSTPGYDNPGSIEAEYSEAINHATHSVEMANNSWGVSVVGPASCTWMGDYTSTSELFDEIVRGATDTYISVVFSAGNERDDAVSGDYCGTHPNDPPNYFNNYKVINPPKPAKNVIAVGATNSDDDSMTSFSSWGPVDDGRLKPDVVAPGCEKTGGTGIKSTIPNLFIDEFSRDCDGTGDDYCFPYDVMCGTSMAAPHVTGTLALMLQYYWSTHGGTATTPLPSTLKAVLIHTAKDMYATDTSYYRLGPDYSSGYGRIDALKAVEMIQKDNATDGIYILEGNISNGATDTFSFRVPSGQSEVKVTVVWDDRAGVPNDPSDDLVNDIDIVLVDPNNNIKYPWSLDPDHASNTATHNGTNTRDNVEQVYATSPTAWVWKLLIRGTTISSATQSYSIVTDFPLGEPKHAIWDSASNAVAIFGYDGNLYLKGTLTDYATSGCLTPTAAAEFIIQTATDTVKTIINSSTGNMCIAGGVNENQTSIISPADRPDFIVQDKDSNNLSLISNAGDLYLKGEVYERSIP